MASIGANGEKRESQQKIRNSHVETKAKGNRYKSRFINTRTENNGKTQQFKKQKVQGTQDTKKPGNVRKRRVRREERASAGESRRAVLKSWQFCTERDHLYWYTKLV